MMAGNPNWWSMHPPPPSSLIPPQYVLPSPSSSSSNSSSNIPFNPLTDHQNSEPPHHSWSQLLFTGLPGEEERLGFTQYFQPKKLEENSWDHQQFLDLSSGKVTNNINIDVTKQVDYSPQINGGNNLYGREEFQAVAAGGAGSCNWSHMVAVSSPTSCVTNNNNNNNNNILDFTYNNNNHAAPDHTKFINQLPDQTSSECNSTSTASVGAASKKARVQPSSTPQPHLKVRKEKLGDRITALHQIVSPFGKTDTASVLLEAIGYIRFLQGQIEALSSPYMDNASKNKIRNHQSAVHGERNSVFPEDPGQLLNDNGLKRKGAPNQDGDQDQKGIKDLKSRGLCLVPVSCTQHVGNENAADYWAPAFGSGF